MQRYTFCTAILGVLLLGLGGCASAEDDGARVSLEKVAPASPAHDASLQFSTWTDCMSTLSRTARTKGRIDFEAIFGLGHEDVKQCKQQNIWKADGEQRGVILTAMYAEYGDQAALDAGEVKRRLVRFSNDRPESLPQMHDIVLPVEIRARLEVISAYIIKLPLAFDLYIARVSVEFEGVPRWLLMGVAAPQKSQKFVRSVMEDFIRYSTESGALKVIRLP